MNATRLQLTSALALALLCATLCSPPARSFSAQKIVAGDPAVNDAFGGSVDLEGDYALVATDTSADKINVSGQLVIVDA